ncbi:MAG: RNA polymerase factor sigma-54 [Rhodobacteraceae bacterium]|nr:RNA polymerase factor sigma-54 [Paracoccaceae bacterium]
MRQPPRILIAQQQRLALNTSLHAAIRLLRSDTAGLTRYLEEQTAENPHLRLIPPEAASLGDWLPRWSGVLAFGSRGAAGPQAEAAAASPSLVAHVMQCVQSMDLPPSAQPIALTLVESLEPSGWLGRSTAAIAKDLSCGEEAVLAVLKRLQTIDPPGLFARNLAECLMLQLADSGQLDREMKLILAHLDLLAAGEISRLAALCGCGQEAITQRFRLIRSLNPKPGTDFSLPNPAHAREPDLLAHQLKDGRWQVALNRSALPSLEVFEGPEKAKADAQAISKARALNHMLAARNSTVLRVGREIVARQVAALVQGPGALRPMTMADLAEALDLHVSTISRVVAGASMDSPYGTWWLRRMFSAAHNAEDSGQSSTSPTYTVAAAALRHRLTRIIAAEPPGFPLSDAALAERLAQETGVSLARRTVAQYREAEGIPPAHRRRRQHPVPPRKRGTKRPDPS